MRKAIRYVLAFVVGTVVSGGVAYAGTSYVQAQKTSSSIYVNGNKVASPPMLVYGGSAYIQLYSIQQGLRNAGLNPTWNGSKFTITAPQVFYNEPAIANNQNATVNEVAIGNKTYIDEDFLQQFFGFKRELGANVVFFSLDNQSQSSSSDFATSINNIVQQELSVEGNLANLNYSAPNASDSVRSYESNFRALLTQTVSIPATAGGQQVVKSDLAQILGTLSNMAELTAKAVDDDKTGADTTSVKDAMNELATLYSSEVDQFNQDINLVNGVSAIKQHKLEVHNW